MRYLWIRACGIGLAIVGAAFQSAAGDEVDDAIHGDSQQRQAALVRLRDQGPTGVERLMQRYHELEKQSAASPRDARLHDKLAALDTAIDQVGGARYCRRSGLYWYTDFEQAKAAAREAGKPILALRLLGNLTDEYSCANSRFFRVVLYSNDHISRYLRENFILTWKSVRPVPKITIDFGDGRKLERTLTGNSIHYILTPDGLVVDALPGLYGPSEFLQRMKSAGDLAREAHGQSPAQQAAFLAQSHLGALHAMAQRWDADLAAVSSATNNRATGDPLQSGRWSGPDSAVVTAVRRHGVDLSALAAVNRHLSNLERRMTDELWEQVAARHSADATIDNATRERIREHRPNAAQAGRLAITKRVVEDPLLRLVQNLERSMALDAIKNEYALHRKLRAWLAATPALAGDVEKLNERVYAELFLMPTNDPWLGLAPPDVYSALPDNGVVTAAR